jgi:hypothetical protein
MFIQIPDPNFFNPGSWIRIKEFQIFKPNSSRIRIRNTGDYHVTTCHRATQRKQRFCTNIHAWLLGPDLDQDSESGSTNAVELGSNPHPIQIRNAVLFQIQIGFGRNFATRQTTGAKDLCWLLLPRDGMP